MKCNEFDKSKSRHHNHTNLDNLDKALHDLGMLSAITEARREILRESQSNISMRLNTRYVSNVTVGYCMRRTTTKNRLCPYVLPARHRTKSENSDAMATGTDVTDSNDFKSNLFEPSTSSFCKEVLESKSPAKRCQSLENLNLLVDPPPSPQLSPDMDCVSTQIQKLQVDE